MDELKKIRDLYGRMAFLWKCVYYILGLIATIASITVASNPTFIKATTDLMELLPWISAVCIATSGFLTPTSKASGYINAQNYLQSISKDANEQDINNAKIEARKIIQRSSPFA